MGHLYVACDLGAETGRVMLGTLHAGEMMLSEVRRISNVPVQRKGVLEWNIAGLYQEVLDSLQEIGAYEETVHSISCDAWAGDYLLFESDGALLAPVCRLGEAETADWETRLLAKVPWEAIYEETGIQRGPASALWQLGAEKRRRLKRASHLLPVADGFNYMLCGAPRIEASAASMTQLFNPTTRAWSERLLQALDLPHGILPPVVKAGSILGRLRPELARAGSLDGAAIVSSCSYDLAAALAGLPVEEGEEWGYLFLGTSAVMGTELGEPTINDASRGLNFSHGLGYNGAIYFSKPTLGLWILEECLRYWKQTDRELDDSLLKHLAISAPPFEALINPADPRFLDPGDMPLKVQAFCKETNQSVPRKPGPIIRCVLESLALAYRQTFRELEYMSGKELNRLYLLGSGPDMLLNHFISSALEIPVLVAPADAAPLGNVLVQALALGHLKSLAEARAVVRQSFKMETIIPRGGVWDAADERLAELLPA